MPFVSATVRDRLDRFYTPDREAQLHVDALAEIVTPRRVLEPSVGGGAYVRAARARWPGVHVVGVDIDPDAPGLKLCDERLAPYGTTDLHPDDMFGIDLALGNPPYALAYDHVSHLLRTVPAVSMLLRVGFLGTRRRRALMQRHPLHEMRVFPWRLSFVGPGGEQYGDGVDMHDHAVFTWVNGSSESRIAWF